MAQEGSGVAFLVSAAVVYDIVAATNSSPQTTEINAAARADTLMKWVNLGMAQGLAFIVLAAVFDGQKLAILSGGGLAAVLLYAQYWHARESGLRSCKPGTETYGPPPVAPAPPVNGSGAYLAY